MPGWPGTASSAWVCPRKRSRTPTPPSAPGRGPTTSARSRARTLKGTVTLSGGRETILVWVVGEGRRGEYAAVVQGSPLPVRGDRALRVAVLPVPAVVP